MGNFSLNAAVASDVSENLEKKHTASDKAMTEIIEQCNKH